MRLLLDFNLPGYFDGVFRWEIESILHLHGVAEQNRKQRQAPAMHGPAMRIMNHQISRSHELGGVDVDRKVEALRPAQGAPQVRYLKKSEARHQVPQSLAEMLDHRAVGSGYARGSLEHHAESNGLLRQYADKFRMVDEQPRHLLCASGEKHRGALHAGNESCFQVGEEFFTDFRTLRERRMDRVDAVAPGDHDDEQHQRERQLQPAAFDDLGEIGKEETSVDHDEEHGDAGGDGGGPAPDVAHRLVQKTGG